MDQLPYELVDLVCEWLSLQEMSILSTVSKFFSFFLNQNYFYSFCKVSFLQYYLDSLSSRKSSDDKKATKEKCIRKLMKHQIYFKRFYLCNTKTYKVCETFDIACSQANLQVAKWLKQNYPQIFVYEDDDDAEEPTYNIVRVCMKGHIEFFKWLVKIYPENMVRNWAPYAFCMTCQHGHLELAKLLIEMFPTIDVDYDNTYDYPALSAACINGHFELAKWLLEIRPHIRIAADKTYILQEICGRGHLEIAKFLVEKLPPTSKWFSCWNFGFKKACKAGHLEVAKWLATLCPNYVIVQETPVIIYKIKKNK